MSMVYSPQNDPVQSTGCQDYERDLRMSKPRMSAQVTPPARDIPGRPLREELAAARQMIRSGLHVVRQREEALERGLARAVVDAVRPRGKAPAAEPALVLVPRAPVSDRRTAAEPSAVTV